MLTSAYFGFAQYKPHTHLQLIKDQPFDSAQGRFSASTFVLKIVTFAKPQNVMRNAMTTVQKNKFDIPNKRQ